MDGCLIGEQSEEDIYSSSKLVDYLRLVLHLFMEEHRGAQVLLDTKNCRVQVLRPTGGKRTGIFKGNTTRRT